MSGKFLTDCSSRILPHGVRDLEKIYTQIWYYDAVLGQAWFFEVAVELGSLCPYFLSTF